MFVQIAAGVRGQTVVKGGQAVVKLWDWDGEGVGNVWCWQHPVTCPSLCVWVQDQFDV